MSETPAEKPRETGPGLSTESSPAEELLETFSRLPEGERRPFLERHPGLATAAAIPTLCALANASRDRDLAHAETTSRAALWLAKQLGDEQGVGLSRRAVANILHATGDFAAALEGYESARDRFRSIGDRLQEAITLSSGLATLAHVGGHERAHRWHAAARQTFEELGERLRLARLQVNYGTVLVRQDLWQQAMALFESALDEFQGSGQAHDAAICLRNMATCHISLMHTQEALDCHLRAKALIDEHDLVRLGLENDYNIAYLYYQTADYARAIRQYRRSRRGFEEIGDERHQALCDLDLSEVFLELNMVEEAAELANWARESFDRLGLRYESARAVANLGVAISRQGRIFEALEVLAKARTAFVEEANEVWPHQIELYEAALLYREGRRFEASSRAQRAATNFKRLGLAVKAAACALLRARIALDENDLEAAKSLCDDALGHLAEHPSSSLHFESQLLLGMVLEAAGQRRQAQGAYRRARDEAEHLRSQLQTEDLKFGFFSSKMRVYEALVAVALQRAASAGERAEIFAAMEKAKTRSIADLMAFRAHALQPKGATRSNLAEKVRSLREELNWYYRQLDLRQMNQGDAPDESLGDLRRRSLGKERRLARTLEELAATDRELASLQSAAVTGLEEIRAALPADTILVEYLFARGAVYAAVVAADHVEMLPLTMVSRVREQQRMLQFQLSRLQLDSALSARHLASVERDTRNHLATLFDELISPIWPRLLRYQELLVVPHGFLHHLPFSALFDGSDFMVDRFRITSAPSASVAHLCRLKPSLGPGPALVVGVPPQGEEAPPTPQAEARAVAEALPGSQLLLDRSLDAPALEEALRSHSLLHLATRARYRQDNPMFSTLELGEEQLTLFDIYNLRLEADLVTLTGCSAGLDPLDGSDALLGLSRGLLYAGARAVMLEMWQTEPASQRAFLQQFYSLLADRPAGEALREAQLAHRRRYAHPFFWAPYVLIGAGR